MSDVDLPENWREIPLGSLGIFFRGQGGTRSDESDNGLPCIRYGDLYTHHDCIVKSFCSAIKPDRSSAYTPLQFGDVVFAGSGETFEEIGKAAAYCGQEKAYAGGDTIIFRPSSSLDSYFAGYAVNSHHAAKHKSRLGQGSSVIHISAEHLARISLRLPPIRQQQTITTILQTIDRAIAHTEALIEKYQQIKAGLMHDLFTRGIGADGKLRPTREEAPELYQESAIGWIPREWNVVSLSHISDIVRGSTPRPARDPRYFDGDFIPWITVGELSREDWPYLYRTETMLTELGSSFSRVLPKGTLVISNSGYGCGVPKILHLTGCANDGVAAFLNLDESCDQLFLYYKLYSQIITLRKKVARGNDQPNLNTDMLGEFRVALPCELEQRKIAEIIWKIDTKIQSERNSLEKFKLKKLGLMQDLLSGKVPVKLESNEVDHISN